MLKIQKWIEGVSLLSKLDIESGTSTFYHHGDEIKRVGAMLNRTAHHPWVNLLISRDIFAFFRPRST